MGDKQFQINDYILWACQLASQDLRPKNQSSSNLAGQHFSSLICIWIM